MTLFAIIPQGSLNGDSLNQAVSKVYPNESYNLGDGGWLVSDSATAKTVCDKLGITEGENGSAVVVEIASYYGRANPAIWTWMKTWWENSSRG